MILIDRDLDYRTVGDFDFDLNAEALHRFNSKDHFFTSLRSYLKEKKGKTGVAPLIFLEISPSLPPISRIQDGELHDQSCSSGEFFSSSAPSSTTWAVLFNFNNTNSCRETGESSGSDR